MESLPILALILAATTKSSSNPLTSFLPFVLILAVGYFLIIRPRQNKARKQRTQVKQLSVGDDVVSIGGIYGRVVDINDTDVQVEVSPGVVMTFLRRAVNLRVDPGGSRAGPASPPDPDDGESDPPEWDPDSEHGFGVPSQDPLDAPPQPRDRGSEPDAPSASTFGSEDADSRPDGSGGGAREGR